MAVDAALAGLPAEISCPICLDGLQDPVTIECGHNFCHSCIRQSWADLQDRFPCPVCRHSCQESSYRVNTQLGKMVEMAKILHSTRSKKKQQGKRGLCEQHNQALTLFCEDDLELLCPLCTQPPDHQGHQLRPIGEAASHHRLRLYSYTCKQMADAQKSISIQSKELKEVREKVKKQKQKLASEFEHLSQFMERKQKEALSRLAEEEKDIQQKLNANTTAFSDYLSSLKGLVKEMAEKKHVMPDVKFLMDIKGVFHHCDNLKPPAIYWFQLRREEFSLPPQCSALQNIIQRFREEVTLDPKTAHPNLLVAEDKKSVTFVRKKHRVRQNRKGFAVDPVVLGTEGFDCGRHYWEVQVDDKPEWAVGVCKDSLSKQTKQLLERQENGCWTIQLQGGVYVARGSVPVTLVLKETPRGIGIYLDYELGQVSFYNLNDMSHIHSFWDTFSGVLKPYFYIGCDPKPLTVCALRD